MRRWLAKGRRVRDDDDDDDDDNNDDDDDSLLLLLLLLLLLGVATATTAHSVSEVTVGRRRLKVMVTTSIALAAAIDGYG